MSALSSPGRAGRDPLGSDPPSVRPSVPPSWRISASPPAKSIAAVVRRLRRRTVGHRQPRTRPRCSSMSLAAVRCSCPAARRACGRIGQLLRRPPCIQRLVPSCLRLAPAPQQILRVFRPDSSSTSAPQRLLAAFQSRETSRGESGSFHNLRIPFPAVAGTRIGVHHSCSHFYLCVVLLHHRTIYLISSDHMIHILSVLTMNLTIQAEKSLRKTDRKMKVTGTIGRSECRRTSPCQRRRVRVHDDCFLDTARCSTRRSQCSALLGRADDRSCRPSFLARATRSAVARRLPPEGEKSSPPQYHSHLILDPANPYRFVELAAARGSRLLSVFQLAEVGTEYGGANLGEHDGSSGLQLVVTIVPTPVTVASAARAG